MTKKRCGGDKSIRAQIRLVQKYSCGRWGTRFVRLGLAQNTSDKWFILGLCLGGKSYDMPFYGLIHPSYVMQSESLTLAVPSPPAVQFNVYTNIPYTLNPSLRNWFVLIPLADRGLVQLPNPPSSTDGGGSTDQCQYVKGERTALNEVYIAYLN